MRAEIEQDSAALRRIAALAPDARSHGGAEALEPRLEANRVTERALGEQPPRGQEVAVPAAIMESGETPAGGGRLVQQRLGLVGRDGQRLVDDDGEVATQRLARELH